MSRKTRKLMWSVPLIAAVAVIGALAAFVVLTPNQAAAHEAERDVTALHVVPGPVSGITVTTPSIANGGRSSLELSWKAPASGDPALTYRVDYSTDARTWMNVTRTLTDADAKANCASSDDANRCFTAGNANRKAADALDPNTIYHFRVFAMNDSGTGGISVRKTIGTGQTLPIDPPDPASGLTATDYYQDKIEVNWQAPADDGGANIAWYCVNIASVPDGAFTARNVLATAAVDTGNACLGATAATDTSLTAADGTTPTTFATSINALTDTDTANNTPVNVVVDAYQRDADGKLLKDAAGNSIPNTMFVHKGLKDPEVLSLRYQVWAVTDDNGDAAGGRRMSLAASNEDTGRTVAPPADADPKYTVPHAPRNVRIVAYSTGRDDAGFFLTGTGDVDIYWNAPANFPEEEDDQVWFVQVQRVVPDGSGSKWVAVGGEAAPTAPAADYATPQFSVDMAVADSGLDDEDDTNDVYGAPTLFDATPDDGTAATISSGQFRVRYVNPGADDDPATEGHQNTETDDDVDGAWANVNISLPLTAADYMDTTTLTDSTLAIITKEAANGADHTDLDADEGLRFTRNPSAPKTRIDLRWKQDANANTIATTPVETVRTQTKPTGYVIDRSDDGGDTWQALFRATNPADLGTATKYTDSRNVAPGVRYIYRVFPVFINNVNDEYGWPAEIHASSEQAGLPAAVKGLTISPKLDDDGNPSTTTLVLRWNAVTETGGHPVIGYLVQIANDTDNDMSLSAAPTWTTVGAPDTGDAPLLTTRVPSPDDENPKNPLKYEHGGLSAEDVRWFRVFAITRENDGVPTTGGEQVDIVTGALRSPPAATGDAPSAGEALPEPNDETRAEPEYGQTAKLDDPTDDPDPDPPAKPLDVTVEAASDTNTQADSNRGVFITWNEPKIGKGETGIDSYIVEWKRMNTGVAARDRLQWERLATVEDATSYTHPLPLFVNTETREYRVGSKNSKLPDPNFADPVTYALHLAHEPDAPMNVMAESSADGTMLTVSWDAPGSDGGSAITHYVVSYKVSGSDAEYMSMRADNTSATISGLSPNTGYDISVVAVNAEGRSSTVRSTGMTADIAPNMPTGVSAMADSRTQITVSWMAPASNGGSAVTGYILERRYDGDMMGDIPSDGYSGENGANRSFAFSNAMQWWETLNCKGMLAAAGSAEDPAGNGPDKMMYCGHFLNTAPSNVTDATTELSAEAKMAVEALFAKRYVVSIDAMTMSHVDMGLMMATEYTYRVRATNAAGAGAWSAAAMATTNANMAPMAGADIDDVTVIEGMTAMAQSNFTDGDNDDLSYRVASDDEAIATATVSDTGNVTITGVSAGSATITVTASDMYGGSAMQTIMVTVESANVAPTAAGTIATVTLVVGDMSEAMNLSMYFDDADAGDTLTYSASSSDESIATVVIGNPAAPGAPTFPDPTSNILTVTAVAVGSATITVTATDAAGLSATQEFTVEVDSGELTAPIIQSAETTGAGELTLTWEGAKNADFYILLAVDINTNEYDRAQVNDGAARTGNITGLDSGTQYLGIVIAVKTTEGTSEFLYHASGIVTVQ